MKQRKTAPSSPRDGEFLAHMLGENVKRLKSLLLIVILSQALFILLEGVGVIDWIWTVFYIRLAIIAICLGLEALIVHYGKVSQQTMHLGAPLWLIAAIQLFLIGFSSWFVLFLFDIGIYSFSPFMLGCFVVALTYIRNPRFIGLTMFPMLFSLAALLHFTRIGVHAWLGELLVAVVFLLVLMTDSIQSYYRQRRQFLQERNVVRINEKLQALSQIDELTGIYNRRKLKEVLDNFIAIAARYRTPFCAVMLDLDHFKRVNDQYGHAAGDEVLYRFANVIRFTLRSTDVFGRWGGEEFLILIPNCVRADALVLLERVREGIAGYDFPLIGRMNFSAGISEYRGGVDAATLIGQADAAMYAAKRLGRNRVQVYGAEEEEAISG